MNYNILKYRIFLFLMIAVVSVSFSQGNYNILNAKNVSEIGVKSKERIKLDQDKPLPYEYVDERDILWSKVVWETVDLYQKQNLRLYFPVDDETEDSKSNKSLFKNLLDNINEGNIKEVYEDSQFINKLPMEEIQKKLVRVDTSSYGYDLLNEGETNIDEYIDRNFIKSEDIQEYQIKGMWYFNKRTGELKYRLLALAPMAPDVQTIGLDEVQDDSSYPLFWIFYPDAREVLHHAYPYKEGFASSQESFDYILNIRDFSSVIIKEENLYGNRAINEYVRGNSLEQLREADRIKNGIRDLESDMWNY